MASYKTSNGEYWSKTKIDREVEKAKSFYTDFVSDRMHISPDNIPCERCKKTNRQCTGVSRSHIMSVDFCQRTGRSELAADILNFEHLGLGCHRELESHTNEFREAWYEFRKNGIMNLNELADYENFKKHYYENRNPDHFRIG